MTLQEILASLLNPNGTQQAQPMPQMAPQQVGDHGAPFQSRLAAPPQAPQRASAQGGSMLRPFQGNERRPNADGSYSTEISTTWQTPDGQWVNVPSLWMGPKGPQQFNPGDEDGILGAMGAYEKANGPTFARFPTVQAADAAAKSRSAHGGAGAGSPLNASHRAPQATDAGYGGGDTGGGIGGLLQSVFAPRAAQKNATVQWLQSQGYDQGTATILASDKGALRQVIMNRGQRDKPIEVNGRLVDPTDYHVVADFSTPGNRQTTTIDGKLVDTNTGQVIGDYGSGNSKATAAQQDYEYAMKQLRTRGVPEDKLPTFQEFSKPKSRGISFRGADGTEIQIGGEGDGTAYGGTSLPAEVGGRIGLGDNFIKNDYPEVIKMIENGDATGPIDYATGVLGRGNSGIVQRRMASGADALRRGLTGAGMSASESEEYARRYLPKPMDDVATLKLKAEGLKADLEAVTSGAIKGKAGDVGGFLPGGKQAQSRSFSNNDEVYKALDAGKIKIGDEIIVDGKPMRVDP